MTTDNALHFGSPELLVPLALTAVALAGLLVWEAVRRRRALARVATPELRSRLTATVSRPKRTLKRLLLWTAAALTLFALARPQWGYRWEEASRQGIELMFAVDTSKSMLAQDLRPDRLTRAKLAIADLVRKFPSDRVGLVAFAGDAFLQVPMTLDRDVFMDSLQVLQPGVIPVGGSDLASAIRVADQAFTEAGAAERILVLVSDGEDLEGSAITAAERAAGNGVVIHTVGVGGAEGELLTVPDGRGGTTIVRDERGEPVRSRLDEATLTAIAAATGGTYVPLGLDGAGLETLYQTALADLERHEVESRSHRVYFERFAWFLVPAFLLLLLEPFIGERGTARPLLRRGAVGAAVAVAVALTALSPTALAAPAAVETYNEGVAAYEAGDWDAAAQQFTAAVDTAPTELHQQIWYNLGNARYRQGESALETSPAEARAAWEEALSAFETAVELDPEDDDAVFNRDFVAAKLEELDEQEPPPDESDQTCDNPSPDDEGQSNADTESDQGDSGGDQDDSQGDSEGDQGDSEGDQGDSEGDQGDQGDSEGDQGDQGDQGESEGDQGKQDGPGDQSDSVAQADRSSAGMNEGDRDPAGAAGAAREQGGGSEDDPAGTAATPSPQDGPIAGLAATAGEDEGLTAAQAAALIRAAGGNGATVPLFAPDQPRADERTPSKDW